jgi:hypothetical protein
MLNLRNQMFQMYFHWHLYNISNNMDRQLLLDPVEAGVANKTTKVINIATTITTTITTTTTVVAFLGFVDLGVSSESEFIPVKVTESPII